MAMSRRKRVYVLLGILCIALSSAVLLDSRIGWRAGVIGLKLEGKLEDISWSELIHMLSPGSPYFYMNRLLSNNANLYTAIRNPYASQVDVEAGAPIFRSECGTCHGGHDGPDFVTGEFVYGDSDWALFRATRLGIPDTEMPGTDLDEKEIWQMIAYMRSLSVESQQAHADSSGETSDSDHGVVTATSVTFERLRRAEDEPGNWLTYSGTYSGQRYSQLAQINNHTVKDLRLEWVHQLKTIEKHARLEATPLVVDAVMYFTEPPNNVVAVNAQTGDLLWSRKRELPDHLPLCCGNVNRGVAVYEDKVYLGTLDAHLVAMNSGTGDVIWDVEVADPKGGSSKTAAPLALNGKIIVGVAGGEFPIRGFIDAYDAATGERIWRFHTVPGPGEPGHESWPGDSWKTGGSPTWMTGSFDPDLNLIYWGVGNPAPEFQADVRIGDNLYSNSVIALDPDSGELKWHFQFTPQGEHDWDSNSVPVLVDTEFQGKPRKLLLMAVKNGFYYVLDRVTGEFLLAREIVKQTWAEKIDEQGRPIRRPNTSPSTKGTLVYPGSLGGANWWPPSYSPRTNLFYLPVLEMASIYFRSPVDLEEGREKGMVWFTGSAIQGVSGAPHYTAIRALVAGTDQLKWEFKLPPRMEIARIGGALSTAGDLVFFGDKDHFYALDARSGEELWRIRLGGEVNAAPMTYLSEGRQHLTIATGRSIFTFALPKH